MVDNQPANQLANFCLFTNPPTNQSTKEPKDQTTNQPNNQSTKQPKDQTTKQTKKQIIAQKGLGGWNGGPYKFLFYIKREPAQFKNILGGFKAMYYIVKI